MPYFGRINQAGVGDFIPDGSIENKELVNSSITLSGIGISLGDSITQPAFDLTLATNLKSAALDNNTVSYGGVTLGLGSTDATPAFDLTNAVNYPTSSLTGTITNAQLAGSISNDKLVNSSVSFGGVTLSLGSIDTTPAFDLSDATNYSANALTGTTLNSGVTASSLTSLGTLTSLNVTNTANFNGNINILGNINNVNTTGVATFNAGLITTEFAEKVNNIGNGGTNMSINLSNGSHVVATLSEPSTNITFSTGINVDSIGFTLVLTNGADNQAIVWPSSIKWPANTTPSRTTANGKTDIWVFVSSDGGTRSAEKTPIRIRDHR